MIMRKQDYTVAIVCALPVELTAVCAMLDEIHDNLDERFDNNCYTFGSIGKHNVVVACLPNGRYGVVSAAIVANRLLQSFHIKIGLMVGIAGGVPSSKYDLQLGDVVVSKPTNQHGGVIQYDLGKVIPKRTADGQMKEESDFEITGHLNHPPEVLLQAISKLESTHSLVQKPRFLSFLYEAGNRYPKLQAKYQRPDREFDRLYQSQYEHNDDEDLQSGNVDSPPPCNNCDPTFLRPRNLRENDEPKIHYGLIASGNRLIRHARTRDGIASKTGAMCFEMEAAGLMSMGNGFLVVRGICDYADSHKNEIFQPYAAAVAAAYARELLEAISPNEVAEEKSNKTNKEAGGNERIATDLETETVVANHSAASYSTAQEFSRNDVLECQNSLYFHELEFRQIDIKPAAHDTCKWILEHPVFLKWLSDQKSMLWIKGKPGVGKSTLMDFIFSRNKCQMGIETGKTITCSFFFHGRGGELQRTRLGLARSMLHQLLAKCPFSAPRLVQTYLRRQKLQEASGLAWDWTAAELLSFLAEAISIVVQSYSILIFVDALDEGGEEEAVPLVEYFSNLMDNTPKTCHNIKVCFSCRHYPIICYYPGLTICVEDENAEDIERYIYQQLHAMGLTNYDLNNLRDLIISKAAGVFQWVSLVIQRISKSKRLGKSPRLLQAEVELIPSDLEALYRKILNDLDYEEKPESLKLLQWVAFASVPLRAEHMRLALIIDENSTYDNFLALLKDDRTGDIVSRITNLSGGIVEIRIFKGERVVQFIHETARGFFLKEGFEILNYYEETMGPFVGVSHRRLASSCIRYFLLRDTESILADLQILRECELLNFDDCEEFAASEQFFLDYTQGAWIYHADRVNESGVSYYDLTSKFGERSQGEFEVPSHGKYRQLTWERMGQQFDAHFRTYSKRYISRPLNLLHVTAQHGWTSVLQGILVDLVDIGVDADLKDSSKTRRTPLSYAAEAGQLKMVKLLLQREDVDPNTRCTTGRTPLSYCSKEGHTEIAKLLLEKDNVKVDFRDQSGRTALSYASEAGYFEVVELLLEAGADHDSKDGRGRTPLFYSSREGREAVVELLLGMDNIDVDAQDYRGYSAFFVASQGGFDDIEQLLVERGASTSPWNSNGETPLFAAVIKGDFGWLTRLLRLGVDINAQDADGRTALSYAAEQIRYYSAPTRLENFVKFMIEQGANVHLKDKRHRKPMSYAMKLHDLSLIELLKQNGEEFTPRKTAFISDHVKFRVRSWRDKKDKYREERDEDYSEEDSKEYKQYLKGYYGYSSGGDEEEEEDEEDDSNGDTEQEIASEEESEVPSEEHMALFGPEDYWEGWDECYDDYGSPPGYVEPYFERLLIEEAEESCREQNRCNEYDDDYWQAFWVEYGIKDDSKRYAEEHDGELWEEVWDKHLKRYCT